VSGLPSLYSVFKVQVLLCVVDELLMVHVAYMITRLALGNRLF